MAERAEGQVEAELEHLRSTVAENAGAISALEDRLSVVLLAEPPETACDKAVPEIELCDLANVIRRSREEILSQTERLRRIIRRIEL
jgi:hypothetical protein